MTEIRLQPRQEAIASSPADIAIIGGAPGGGKTFYLTTEPLRHISSKKFTGVTLRRTMPEVTQAGGIWDEATAMYPLFGGRLNEMFHRARFPSGAEISFSHLQHEKTKYSWRSAQIALLQFDQLESFTEPQFFYMLSRNRAMYKMRAYCRAGANPEPNWLADFLMWWLDQDGYADPDKDGKIRWMARAGDRIVWGDSREELQADYRGCIPMSVAFFLSTIFDNKILMERDPEYLGRLMSLPYIDRIRLLGDDPTKGGNWFIKPTAGKVFSRSWWNMKSAYPKRGRKVRYWDLAATEPSKKNTDPDWTAGVLMVESGRQGWVADVVRARDSAKRLENLIKTTAAIDGKSTEIHIEQEGGAGSKLYLEHIRLDVLGGYAVYTHTVSKNKIERAKPLSSMVESGNVFLVEGGWNKDYIDELHNFPDGSHDDQVDASSGAYNTLFSGSKYGGIYA